MGLFVGESMTLEQIGLFGKSLGKPLGRLSLTEHPERKSPPSSSVSLVTSAPTTGTLFALADREPIQSPGVAQTESGLGAWTPRLVLRGRGQGLAGASGSVFWLEAGRC